jgi:hypothetical protein
MALLHVEKLFRSLSHEERAEVSAALRDAKSGTLSALFDILCELDAANKTLGRSKLLVFKRLYGQAHSQSKDYLFRQLCHALAEKIKAFMAARTHQDDFEKNRHRQALRLLESLLARKLFSEFISHYKRSRQEAIAACEFDIALSIDLLYVKYLSVSRVPNKESLQQTIAQLQESEHLLKQFFITTRAYLDSIHGVAAHYLQHFDTETAPRPTLDSVCFHGVANPLAQYFHHKALTFYGNHKSSVKHAEFALSAILPIENDSPRLLYEKMSMIVNVGLMYMLNGEYAKAHRYYAQALSFSDQHQLPIDAALLFNYASLLMKLEAYQAALELFEAHWNNFAASDATLHRAQALRVYCYLFLNRLSEAQQHLPDFGARVSEPVRYYSRYAQIAIFYQQQHFDDALRETESFSKRLRRQKQTAAVRLEQTLVGLYHRFIKLSFRSSAVKQRPALQTLRSHLEAFVHSQPVYADTQPVVWLKKEIEQLSSD